MKNEHITEEDTEYAKLMKLLKSNEEEINRLKRQIDALEKVARFWEQDYTLLKNKYEPEVFAVPDTTKFSLKGE